MKIFFFMKFLILIIPFLVSIAFLTLLERKILSLVGLRLGPYKVSFLGIFQPIADALKLSNKQVNSLTNFSFYFYYFSSFFFLVGSLFLFFCLFSDPQPVSFKFSIVFFFLILSFNSLNSIILGWSTFSKFSLIGSIRTVAQLISYEAVIYICLIFLIFYYFSFDIFNFSFYYISFFFFFLPYCFYIWIPSFLCELNRTPYDFSESESELVSGFNTEFGSLSFTLIFLGEYGNIVFFCLLSSFFFFLPNFFFFFFFFFLVIWIRSVLPRFRFDKLMYLAWKFYIPFLTFFLIFFLIFIY